MENNTVQIIPQGFVPEIPNGFMLEKTVDEEPIRKEVERIVKDDFELVEGEKPSLWDKLLRTFEPTWEQQRAKAAISMMKAKETGKRPSEFEPTTMEAVETGLQSSVTGLIYRGKKPGGLTPEQMKELSTTQRILMQGATLTGDLPFMMAGAIFGSPGGPPTMFGGAFALPSGMRRVLMDKYEKGDIESFGTFWRRLIGASEDTLKGMATGVATQYAGSVGGLPAEIAAMVTVGNALEGTVPEPTDFLDAAVLIGGLRVSTKVAGKLRGIYKETGKTPEQVLMDIEEDPYIRKELLSDSKEFPEVYRKVEVEKPAPPVAPEKAEGALESVAGVTKTTDIAKIKTQLQKAIDFQKDIARKNTVTGTDPLTGKTEKGVKFADVEMMKDLIDEFGDFLTPKKKQELKAYATKDLKIAEGTEPINLGGKPSEGIEKPIDDLRAALKEVDEPIVKWIGFTKEGEELFNVTGGKHQGSKTASELDKLGIKRPETDAEIQAKEEVVLQFLDEDIVDSLTIREVNAAGGDTMRAAIIKSQKEGKIVPENVLKDYPDLKPTPIIEKPKLIEDEISSEINAIAEETAQRGAFTIDLTKEIPTEEPFKFGTPEIEQRVQAAKGVPKETFWEGIKNKLDSIGHKITREYENLPKTEKFAQLSFDLRRLAKQKSVSSHKTYTALRGITQGLSKNDYNLFWRKVLLDDLAETAKEGKALPFGFGRDTVKAELLRLNSEISQNSQVTKSIEIRNRIWNDLKDNYIKYMKDIGVDVSGKISRENYFRHQVLDYAEVGGITGTGKRLKTPTSRGFLKRRKGSELDINVDYLEAEGEVMAQMLYDIEVAKTLKAVDQNYSITKQLQKQAKKEGIENWRELVPEDYEAWQPRQGNVFYLADSIPAKLAEQLASGALEEIGLTVEQVRQVLAVGGKRKEFVIKTEVADTLNNLVTDKTKNMFSAGHKEMIRWWKIWQLISPRRFFKYNTRNLTGDADAVFAGRPSVFLELPEAVKDLWNVHGKGKVMTGELKDWFERGGMQANLQIHEMGELNQLKMFMHLQEQKTGLTKLPLKIWQGYWKTARLSTDFREAVLRYSAYKRFLKEMRESPTGMPKDFAASIPEEVKGLSDIKDRAYLMSNDLLGAYDRVGVMGQALREHLYPFWSWKEANFRRYYRMFRNATSSQQAMEILGRKALGTVAATPFRAARIGSFLLKATAFWSAIQVWNNTKYPEEEKMLPAEVRNRPHIVLGRNENGEILAFTRIGALGDLLEWFGLDAAPQYVDGLFQGKMTPKEIALDMAKQPLNIIVQGGEPSVKMGAELLSRRALFPDIYKPQTIRDKSLHLMRSIGLENEYLALTGKPSRGYKESLESFFIYKYDPLQTAYGDLLNMKRKFLESKGKGGEGFWITPRGNHLYEARLALRYKDDQAALESMAKYMELGGKTKDDVKRSLQGIKASIEAMKPLSGLSIKERSEFVESLKGDDVRTLLKAQLFFMELQTGQDISKIIYGDNKGE